MLFRTRLRASLLILVLSVGSIAPLEAKKKSGDDLSIRKLIESSERVKELSRRMSKIESEVNALQRKVFPGGSPEYFVPENNTSSTLPPVPTTGGYPKQGSEYTDVPEYTDSIAGQIMALEQQVQSLTGQLEQANFKIRALEVKQGIGGEDTSMSATTAVQPLASLSTSSLSADKLYSLAHGYYKSRQYDQAIDALQSFATRNPQDKRSGQALYWLGRSYIKQSKYNRAAKAFLTSFKQYPIGKRAPDSLLYLGRALHASGNAKDACKSYKELEISFPEHAKGRLKSGLKRAEKLSRC